MISAAQWGRSSQGRGPSRRPGKRISPGPQLRQRTAAGRITAPWRPGRGSPQPGWSKAGYP